MQLPVRGERKMGLQCLEPSLAVLPRELVLPGNGLAVEIHLGVHDPVVHDLRLSCAGERKRDVSGNLRVPNLDLDGQVVPRDLAADAVLHAPQTRVPFRSRCRVGMDYLRCDPRRTGSPVIPMMPVRVIHVL